MTRPKLIDRITIQGYKAFANVKLDCGQKNIILGANGSGKSTLIEAFDLVRQVLDALPERFVLKGEDEHYHHHGVKRTPFFGISLGLHNFEYSVRFESSRGQSWLDGQLVKGPGGGGGWQSGGLPNEAQCAGVPESVIPSLELLRSLVAPHHFHDTSDTSRIRRACPVDDNRQLRADGSNLAAYLYSLKLGATQSYTTIVRTIQQIAPWFQDFNLAPQRNEPTLIKLEWRHRDSENYFDGFSLSDGSLRFMCLATLLLQPSPPPLILLDEPEIGLHPAALALLAEMLQMVDSQLFVATQSPALVDYFEVDDIVVAEYDHGGAELKRPPAHELDLWLRDYSLGTLWEKNLLGGRP